MIQSTKKGAVLIVVTMIVLILSLLATGLFVIVGKDSQMASQNLNDAKLRFAAEGGVKAMYHNLCRLTPEQVKDSDSKTDIGDGEEIIINGLTVKMHAEKDATDPVWKLWASATDTNGKTCEITLSNIKGNTVLEKSIAITTSMKNTGTFIGPVTRNADNSLTRGDNVDHFRGKTYFGGDISIGGVPWFEGDCIYAASTQTASKHNGSNTNPWLSDPNNLKHKGLLDAGWVEKYAGKAFGDKDGTDDRNVKDYGNRANMEARFNKMFEGGSYTISDAPVSFDESTYSWDQLNKTPGTTIPSALSELRVLNLPKPEGSDAISVEFKIDNDGSKKAVISGAYDRTIDLSNFDVITIATNNTAETANENIQVVNVKGIIHSDITLAVDYGVVKLTGDLIYKGFESDYGSMTQDQLLAEGDSTKLDQINAKLKTGDYGKFGLINYNGHVLVDKNSNEANVTGGSGKDDALLFMGAIYAPNGQFGAAAMLTGTNNGYNLIYNEYGKQDKPTNNIISTNGFLQVVTVGSVITKGKAYYKHSSQDYGMAAHFNPDPRYEAGFKPSGFPVTIKKLKYGGVDYPFWQYSTTEMIWSIEWK